MLARTNHVCFIVFCFKQKAAYELRISDWSSDVCSSDLQTRRSVGQGLGEQLIAANPGLMAMNGGGHHDFVGARGACELADACAQHLGRADMDPGDRKSVV